MRSVIEQSYCLQLWAPVFLAETFRGCVKEKSLPSDAAMTVPAMVPCPEQLRATQAG